MKYKQKPLFILFEWLDHVWKTTTANYFAKLLNAQYLYSPTDNLISLREYFDNIDISFETNFQYYLASNITSDFVINCLNNWIKLKNKKFPYWKDWKPISVVLDRYFYTTAAYHSIKLWRNIDYIFNRMKSLPDRIYYLRSDIEVIMNRIKTSWLINPRFNDADFMRKVDVEFQRLFKWNKNVVIIDTWINNQEEVKDIIKRDLLENFTELN